MIKLPNAIIGNSNLLVTMGKRAEILGFFYPRRDYAQHVEESVACIHDGEKLLWSNSHEWETDQRYIEDTNILLTELSHGSGLKMSILDLLHPSYPVLIRRFKISSDRTFKGKFFYHSNLNVGDCQQMNSAFCDPERKFLLQYWQDYCIGIKAAPDFVQWQVGKAIDAIWWTNAKYDMEDGKLQNSKEDIGNINTSLGWDIDIEEGQSFQLTLSMGAGKNRRALYKRLHDIVSKPSDDIIDEVREDWIKWLSRKKPLKIFETAREHELRRKIVDSYNRSLLTLNLLNDPEHGSFVAAPEFDPNFEMCGGYGFCWNRDAVDVILALLEAGYPDYCDRFFKWCKRTQLPDGSWFQRYWIDGKMGPSWGNFYHSTQIDETASTIYAMHRYYNKIEGVERSDFMDDMWGTILRGAEYMMKRTEAGIHDPCIDLWETYSGSFSYTNAAIHAGLLAASSLAESYGEKELSRRWNQRAEKIKENTKDKLWLKDGYFAKGIIHGRIDKTIDTSILGTFTPFNMLSPHNPEERDMIYAMIDKIENNLRVSVNGYYGIKRYEKDHYIEGNPWIVTTLWLSKAMLALANALKRDNEDENKQRILVEKATQYIKWSLKGATNTGLLPEQVDKLRGHPAWAIPLGWSCGLLIENIIQLNKWEFD